VLRKQIWTPKLDTTLNDTEMRYIDGMLMCSLLFNDYVWADTTPFDLWEKPVYIFAAIGKVMDVYRDNSENFSQ